MDRLIDIAEDYQASERLYLLSGETETIKLPKSNVLKYKFTDGSWFCLRPSGTEPKIKFYFGVKGETKEMATEWLNALKVDVMDYIKELIK